MSHASAGLLREIEAFLAQLSVERQVSPHTLAAYRRDLALLLSHAQGLSLDNWHALHTEQVRAFIAAQHRRGLAPKSLQRLLSACRGFFRYLLREGQLGLDPSTGLRAPKAARKLPQILDADEMAQLVQVEGDAPLDRRDRALLELFYSSGLRLSELCALRWRDPRCRRCPGAGAGQGRQDPRGAGGAARARGVAALA
jgi:integrase/recombinase XerC